MSTNVNVPCTSVKTGLRAFINTTCIASDRVNANNLFMHETAIRVEEELNRTNRRWADLARHAGVTLQVVQNWKARGIPKHALKKVSEFFGRSIEWVLTGKERDVFAAVYKAIAEENRRPGDEHLSDREISERVDAEEDYLSRSPQDLLDIDPDAYDLTPCDIDNVIKSRALKLIKQMIAAGIEPAHALGLSGDQVETIQFSDKPLDKEVEVRLLKKMGLSRRDVERNTGTMLYATFSVAELSLKELLDILSGKVKKADKSLRTTALGMIQTYLESDSPRPELIDALEAIIERSKTDKQFIDSDPTDSGLFF